MISVECPQLSFECKLLWYKYKHKTSTKKKIKNQVIMKREKQFKMRWYEFKMSQTKDKRTIQTKKKIKKN